MVEKAFSRTRMTLQELKTQLQAFTPAERAECKDGKALYFVKLAERVHQAVSAEELLQGKLIRVVRPA
jgi:hypothetical protein